MRGGIRSELLIRGGESLDFLESAPSAKNNDSIPVSPVNESDPVQSPHTSGIGITGFNGFDTLGDSLLIVTSTDVVVKHRDRLLSSDEPRSVLLFIQTQTSEFDFSVNTEVAFPPLGLGGRGGRGGASSSVGTSSFFGVLWQLAL